MAGPYLKLGGAGGERTMPLDHLSVCRIGRSQNNDVVLSDQGASRDHAMIRQDGDGGYSVIDAGSRNGTVLNGRRLTGPMKLASGDVIAIGQDRIEFNDPDAAPAGGGAAQRAPVEATMFVAQQSLISVLVIDVRGFTPLSRALGEERLSTVMSTIFRETGTLLGRSGCWSEKFIGDAVMAVWRHENNRLLPTELAAMLGVITSLEQLFATLQERFELPQPLRFGAAINTGFASLGNMGSGNTADFTALGDTVNKAFRLETASKEFAADLVIGEDSFRVLTPPLDQTKLPRAASATLKGYDMQQPVRLLQFADIPGFADAVAPATVG